MRYIYEAVDFLRAPSKSFDSVKGVKLGETFRFVLVTTIVFAVLNGVVGGLVGSYTMPTGFGGVFLPAVIVMIIVASYIGIIIYLTLFGLWLHLWAYIFGARKGLEQTMKSVYYGYSPSYLLGWIPIVSIVFGLWSLTLQGMGIKRLHGMATGRAAAAVIIAFLIPLIVVVVLWLTLTTTLTGMRGIGGSVGGI